MSTIISPNMSLPVPIVGTEPGPDYASDINNCMSIVDSHSHTSGSGVLITPAAININTDLSFVNNRATSLKSVTFQSQSVPLPASSPDTQAVYVSGVDLYYNDGSGNQVRITQSGGVAGTPGSIAGLVSPASATYVSADSTFVWQSAANTPANMDFAAGIFRNLSLNSKGLTLSPPAAMAADYSLVLPALPVANSFMQLDTSGNMSASIPLSKGITASNIADLTITAGQIADGTITRDKLSTSGDYQEFLTSGSYVVPAGVSRLLILGCGGGGGGAGSTNGNGAPPAIGGGGGAGAPVFEGVVNVVPGDTLTITVGTGGIGGSNGSPPTAGGSGTASSVSGTGVSITMQGAAGGDASGNGGLGRGGTHNGGSGSASTGGPSYLDNSDYVANGAGGQAAVNGYGGGGGGSIGTGGAGGNPGAAGGYGAGGGGQLQHVNSNGGAGGPGLVRIYII